MRYKSWIKKIFYFAIFLNIIFIAKNNLHGQTSKFRARQNLLPQMKRLPGEYFDNMTEHDRIIWRKNQLQDQKSLSTINTGDSLNVRLVGRWAKGTCYSVAVSGNIGYFSRGSYLEIVDFSDQENLIELGLLRVPGPINDIAIYGNYALVTVGLDGLRVIDVSTPDKPQEVGFFDTPGSAEGVAVSGSYAYVADYEEGLRVIDVSNPSSPYEVGFFNTGFHYTLGVAIKDSNAYVADGYYEFRIIDISKPASPQEIGFLNPPYPDQGWATDVAVRGNQAYVSYSNSGSGCIKVIDVSTPASPHKIGSFNTSGDASGVSINGSYAYVADNPYGLRVIDINMPNNPIEIGFYNTGADDALGIAVSDQLVFLAAYQWGVYVLEFLGLRPDSPTLIQPANNLYTNDSSLSLSWNVPSDSDGDDLHFKVEISTNSNFNTQVSGSPFESKNSATGFSPTPPVSEGIGESSYTLQTALADGSYYWRVSAWDGKRYSDTSELRIFTMDTAGPITADHYPAKNATGVSASTNITVHVQDSSSGVNEPSIVMKINSITVTPVITGSTNDYVLTYDPPTDFAYKTVVAVSIDANDKAGNVMSTDSYSFTTESESNVAPSSPTGIFPENSSFTNDSMPLLSWSVPSDANGDSLHFKLEIDDDHNWNTISKVIESTSDTTGFIPHPPVTQGAGSVSYTLQSPLTEGDWWWRVAAYDGVIYGSYSEEQKFTIDWTEPITADHDPAKNAAGVSISTNITVHVQDSSSGVKQSSIVMKINNITVTPVITGSTNDYALTCDPPTDFDLNDTIAVSIDAMDNAGNEMETDSYFFVTAGDLIAPQISHSAVPFASSGDSLLISATLTDDIDIQVATLYYRKGGETTFSFTPLINGGGDLYQATIPKSFVTEYGVEYYLSVADGAGNITTFPESNPTKNPQIVQITNSNFSFASSTPTNAYRMVSVPFELDNSSAANVLEDDLGSYDDTKWRLLRWIDGQNVEYSTSGFSSFEPGNGFWLITKDAMVLDAGSGKSVTTGQNYVITLDPGWNQIGDPFAFAVDWDDVVRDSTIVESRLVGYYGNLNETTGYDYARTILKPWEGYFIHNLSSSQATIEIPPIASLNGLAKAKRNVLEMLALEKDEWCVQLTAKCENYLDKDNYLGFLDDARDEWDYHDFSEAPFFDKQVSLYFDHRDWDFNSGLYTGDFRSIKKEGEKWDFSVKSNLSDPTIVLSLTDQVNVPPNWKIFLLDHSNKIKVDIADKRTYEFVLNANEERKFTIAIGENDYIESNENNFAELPTKCTLSQNYPNPFNSSTQISYKLSRPGYVKLSVYSLQGQLIRSLVQEMQNAGRYTATWDSKDNHGNSISSGVYLVKMTTSGFVSAKKIICIK